MRKVNRVPQVHSTSTICQSGFSFINYYEYDDDDWKKNSEKTSHIKEAWYNVRNSEIKYNYNIKLIYFLKFNFLSLYKYVGNIRNLRIVQALSSCLNNTKTTILQLVKKT